MEREKKQSVGNCTPMVLENENLKTESKSNNNQELYSIN